MANSLPFRRLWKASKMVSVVRLPSSLGMEPVSLTGATSCLLGEALVVWPDQGLGETISADSTIA